MQDDAHRNAPHADRDIQHGGIPPIQNIVMDLEFTPTPRSARRLGLHSEIIEIGAVRVDARGNTVDTFCRRVKPAYAAHVAPWIVRLTGIRDVDLRDAEPLEAAVEDFAAWVGPNRTRLVTWSGTDRSQVERECACKGIELPAQMRRWLDLQRIYPRLMQVGDRRRLMSLKTAADWTGAALNVNSAHQALYDAQVTAELLRQLLSGEYRQQRRALSAYLATPAKRGETSTPRLTASLGSRCTRLEGLYRQMLQAS